MFWKPRPAKPQMPYAGVLTIFVMLGLTLVVGAQIFSAESQKPLNYVKTWLSSASSSLSTSQNVTNFQECVKKVGVVLETFPAQCKYQGKTYVQSVSSSPSKTNLQLSD